MQIYHIEIKTAIEYSRLLRASTRHGVEVLTPTMNEARTHPELLKASTRL
jgi:hypothetical protein